MRSLNEIVADLLGAYATNYKNSEFEGCRLEHHLESPEHIHGDAAMSLLAEKLRDWFPDHQVIASTTPSVDGQFHFDVVLTRVNGATP